MSIQIEFDRGVKCEMCDAKERKIGLDSSSFTNCNLIVLMYFEINKNLMRRINDEIK
jgi:hypothetical protein